MNDDVLLNEAQVAVDEALLACDAAADRYADGADMLEDDAELAARLGRAADARAKAASRLRDITRRADHLPRGEDREKESLSSLASHVRAAVALDRRAWVVDMCVQSEQALIEAARAALGFDLPSPLESCLRELGTAAHEAVETLNQTAARSSE
jgi:hypothetical protein